MKRIVKKNQIIVTTLAILIAIAGYLRYTNTNFTNSSKTVDNEVYESVYKEDDLTTSKEDIESLDEDVTSESTTDQPGTAILTNGAANSSYIIQARLNREQTRSKATETLNSIINNENLSKSEKKDAVNSMVQLTEFSEKENNIETLLKAKGYEGVVVSLAENQADVIFEGELNDTVRAQIINVVTRKTDLKADEITITPAK